MQPPEKLESALTIRNINRALIRMPDAAVCPDIEKCNSMLFEAFNKNKQLIPVPTINPKQADWQIQIEKFKSPFVNLYPGYHGYSLQSKEACELAEVICAKGKTILITIRLEDPRASNQYCRFPEVPVEDVKNFIEKFPMLKVIALNISFAEMKKLAQYKYKNFYMDIAYAEILNTLERIISLIPHEQVLFGSNTPLFYTEAASAKITKSVCREEVKENIAYNNLSRIITL